MTESGPRFFATYIEVVRMESDVDPVAEPDRWLNRWQWIVMPKKTTHAVESQYVVFQRYQTTKSHRAVWKAEYWTKLDDLRSHVEQLATSYRGSNLRPPIVVELSEAELDFYVAAAKRTPWKVIERARRVSPKRGYRI